MLKFSLHGPDDLLDSAKLSLEKRMNVLALLGRPGLFHEIGEVLVEVDGPPFTGPIRQGLIVLQEDHESDALLDSPILMLEDRLSLSLPFAVPHILCELELPFLFEFGVALRGAGLFPQ